MAGSAGEFAEFFLDALLLPAGAEVGENGVQAALGVQRVLEARRGFEGGDLVVVGCSNLVGEAEEFAAGFERHGASPAVVR